MELWINLRQVSTARYYPIARSAADDESDPEEYPSLTLWIGDRLFPDLHGAAARRVYEAVQQFTMGGGAP